jgi:hypothetical protein
MTAANRQDTLPTLPAGRGEPSIPGYRSDADIQSELTGRLAQTGGTSESAAHTAELGKRAAALYHSTPGADRTTAEANDLAMQTRDINQRYNALRGGQEAAAGQGPVPTIPYDQWAAYRGTGLPGRLAPVLPTLPGASSPLPPDVYGRRGMVNGGSRITPNDSYRQSIEQRYNDPVLREQYRNSKSRDRLTMDVQEMIRNKDGEQQQEQQRQVAENKYPDRFARAEASRLKGPAEVSNLNARSAAVTSNAQTAASREQDQNARAIEKLAQSAGVEKDRVDHWNHQDKQHEIDRTRAEDDFQQKMAQGDKSEADKMALQAITNFRYAINGRRADATARIKTVMAHMATLVNPTTADTNPGLPNEYGNAKVAPNDPKSPTRYEAAQAQLAEAEKERDGIDHYLKYQGYNPNPDPTKWPASDGKVRTPTKAPDKPGTGTTQPTTHQPGASPGGGNGRVGQAAPPNTSDGDYPTKDGRGVVTVKGGMIVAERPK